MDCAVRLADIDDIDEIEKIAKQNKKEVDFVLRPITTDSGKLNELFVAFCQNQVAGFIRWHKRENGWSIIYEICVDEKFRKIDIAKRLIGRIPKPIRIKCPMNNKSTNFYRHLGFVLTGREIERKHPFNIWVKK